MLNISSNKSMRENINNNLLITFRYIKSHKLLVALIIFIYILFICLLCHIVTQANHIRNIREEKKKV